MGTLSPTRQDMSLMASVGVPHRVPTTLLVSGLLTLQAASGKPVEVDVSVNVNTQPKQPMDCPKTCGHCTRDDETVCGTDGKNYLNPCVLKCRACENPDLAFDYKGYCNEGYAEKGARSGQKPPKDDCIERGLRYEGTPTTTNHGPTDKPDFNSCAALCFEVSGCDKWTWKPSSELGGGCFLYTSKGHYARENPDWISGSLGCNNRRLQEGRK